jgi:hypothetical protein
MCYPLYKGKFAGIGHMAEHALAKEHTTQPYAIQAAYQPAILPCLGTVGITQLVHVYVGFFYIGSYPGAILSGAGRIGTEGYYMGKGRVHPEFELAPAYYLLHRLAHPQLIGV